MGDEQYLGFDVVEALESIPQRSEQYGLYLLLRSQYYFLSHQHILAQNDRIEFLRLYEQYGGAQNFLVRTSLEELDNIIAQQNIGESSSI